MIQRPNITETLTPADEASVVDMVRAAAANGTALYPMGGGTSFDYGWRPRRPAAAISLAGLNRVIDYPADDMTITVETGITIDELNKRLAVHRQWLPVDVAHSDRATVGGVIATNACGPRRFAYGTIRDYLLGFTAVDGSVKTFSGGGRVVKNVAGYNLCRLMAGSRGTLGIITQATLMVRPVPETSALLACEVPTLDLAEKLLAHLIRMPVQPVAVELSAGRSPEGNPLFGPILEGNAARLCVGFEGSAAEADWMMGQLREQWASRGMTSPVLMPNLTTDKLWRWLAALPADVHINVLPSKQVAVIAEVLRIAPGSAIQARAGNGPIAVKLPIEANTGEGLNPETLSVLRAIVAAADGKMSVVGPWPVLGTPEETRDGDLSPETRILRAIKERVDPHGILNPGQPCFDATTAVHAIYVSRPPVQPTVA